MYNFDQVEIEMKNYAEISCICFGFKKISILNKKVRI